MTLHLSDEVLYERTDEAFVQTGILIIVNDTYFARKTNNLNESVKIYK
jgi:hypothetical protein